jgi:hypothetical protein
MTFRKRRIEGLTSAAPVVLGTVGGGPGTGGYAALRAIIARNFASSAKAAAGADVLGTLEVKDTEGRIMFLDAADRDYATAEVKLIVVRDDTATGLTGFGTFVDSTGAAITMAAQTEAVSPTPFKLPFTVTARNFATVTDFLTVDLLLEV